MKDIRTIIANNIKSLRATKRWTQTDLADASGVSFRGLQDVEGGKRSARPSTLKAIAGAFEIPEEKLYLEDLGAKQPQQDLSQIKNLLTAAASELKQEGISEKDQRIFELESLLNQKNEEIRKLKDKIKRLGQSSQAIDVDANDPAFKNFMAKIENNMNSSQASAEEVAVIVEQLFPNLEIKVKERKGAG